ncbi:MULTISPECIES: PKD domain-containing protein [unclassified Candidatus Frackibacter]|uniref:PKD domain-containing protein n=1 Tax=unclassified Candidatus Frackibacter TaxID=2648818 RepID=UPI0008868337|nr:MULTISPECIES: PKD domain-containing protein [unclassified Candidatus Frackibacter]SDC31515.1 PKD domain-containing protein [Candidatus Frackibacter sp. WG11]SEM73329.1 PKD domain-containing protein [Candidatus Frackibacter sp. WG12]SFL59372.1 PKD domain-containing protein [Candidatus Frackibacter sp. WG13]
MRKKYILIAVLLLIPLLLTGCLSNSGASNKNPVIKSLNLSSQTMRADESIDVSVQASDPDGDKIGYSWSATKGKVSGSGANVTYQAPSKAGTYEIKVLVSDAKGGKVTSSKEIQVGSNDSPVINSVTISPSTIQVGETAIVTVDASDPEEDSLSYSYNTTNGSISDTGNSVTYTSPSSTGTYTIEVTVSDGSNSVSTSKDITVTSAVWQKAFNVGNGQTSTAYGAIETIDDNYIVIGGRYDGIYSSSGGSYVMKIDSKGNQVWEKTTLGTTNTSHYLFIKEANNGGYVLAGESDNADKDFILTKIDSQGNESWSKEFNNGAYEYLYDFELTNNGYKLIGSTGAQAGSSDVYSIETDNSGSQLSTNTYITNLTGINKVISTSDGGYLAVGEKDDGTGNNNPYAVKLDSTGVEQWNYTYSTTGSYDRFNGVVETSDNGFTLVKEDRQTLLKLDSQGVKLWETTPSIASFDCKSLKLLFDGSLMMVGRARPVDQYQGVLTKISSLGSELWAKTYGPSSPEDNEFQGVVEISDGYLGLGETENLNTVGDDDFYVVKTDFQGNTDSFPQ